MSESDYPRQLYHPDGRSVRVEGKAQEEKHTEHGWSRQPSEGRQKPTGFGVKTTGSDPMAILIRDTIESVLDERGLGPSRAERAEKRRAATAKSSSVRPAETSREDRKR